MYIYRKILSDNFWYLQFTVETAVQ